eukprot:2572238-Amphidinium_carterae.1
MSLIDPAFAEVYAGGAPIGVFFDDSGKRFRNKDKACNSLNLQQPRAYNSKGFCGSSSFQTP